MNVSNGIAEDIKRCAKELSDTDIISLYKKVKEKLDAENKDEDQVLDGDKSGEEPMQTENNSLVPSVEDIPAIPEISTEKPEVKSESEEIESSIDDLLNSLGLGAGRTEEEVSDTNQVQEKDASIEDDEDIIGGILKGMDLETQPEEVVNTDIKENSIPNTGDDEFSPDKFKTAGRGFQVNRKDKDLMSDGATGPKYKDPEKNPPRTDCRRPSGIRWNRGEENKDKDVDGDKDLK